MAAWVAFKLVFGASATGPGWLLCKLRLAAVQDAAGYCAHCSWLLCKVRLATDFAVAWQRAGGAFKLAIGATVHRAEAGVGLVAANHTAVYHVQDQVWHTAVHCGTIQAWTKPGSPPVNVTGPWDSLSSSSFLCPMMFQAAGSTLDCSTIHNCQFGGASARSGVGPYAMRTYRTLLLSDERNHKALSGCNSRDVRPHDIA